MDPRALTQQLQTEQAGKVYTTALGMPLWRKVAFLGGGIVGGFLLQRMFSG